MNNMSRMGGNTYQGVTQPSGYGLPNPYDPYATQQYNDYLSRLRQQWENQYAAIQNQIASQRANESLAGLNLNLAGDTINQQLRMGGMQENIASLMAQRQRQGQQTQLDLARNRFNTQQNRLGMQDDILRQQHQMATNEVTPGYEMAKRLMGPGY